MHRCGIRLTMTEEKTGKTVFDMIGRRNAVIKRFLTHSIKQKWVIKFSLIDTLKDTMQFENLTELARAWYRKDAPFDEEEDIYETINHTKKK